MNLLTFIAGRALRVGPGRLSKLPRPRLPFSTAGSDRLVIAPQDLRTADPTRASEIYAGRFSFAGKIVVCDGPSPFEMEPPSDEWAEILFGFGWLRHLRAAESNITRANARALVDDFLSMQARQNPIIWRPDVVSRRIMSWLSQAPLVLNEADVRFYRRFLRDLSRQVRHLRRNIGILPDGLPRLQGHIALAYAALCMAGQIGKLKKTTRRLAAELDRQILPDGGHISRNPGVLIELLLDLLPLRQLFTARNVPPPPALLNAIDRMMPMLRFFRHGDGHFAHFNGMGPTPPDLLATVLAYDDARGAPVANAPHSGYQRMQVDEVVLIMDVGGPPPIAVSQEAHAGCLSFELSSKQHRIVVNCGLPATNRANWRQVARSTAAHSTVTFNDTSSCHILATPWLEPLVGHPIVNGPKEVEARREEHAGAVVVRAAHDGYARLFGIVHQRALRLDATGLRLDGEDAFFPAHGDNFPAGDADTFALRFHLHPSVKASRRHDAHGVMLMLPNREVWTFDAPEGKVDLEESVYLGGPDGPRRTQQIVLYGRAKAMRRVRWAFVHAERPDSGTRRSAQQEPELPL